MVVSELEPTMEQLEMLCLHARGLTFQKISDEIFVSPQTVQYRLDRLRERLGAENLTKALALCLAHGYLCVDGRSQELFIPDPLTAAA